MMTALAKQIVKKIRFLSMLFFFTLLISGCVAHHRKDGPPPFPVDVSKIHNAVPKVEPLSRIGNKPYTVFGKHYQVLKSRKNYVAIGVASWYGTQFHHHRTSNGEWYNMLAMTAAHRTLPLPTYVQVTNLRNGLRIIVKVNDRGPFEKNRLIDLSYVAAKKLGMADRGTALVEVKALDPRLQRPRPIFSHQHTLRSCQLHHCRYPQRTYSRKIVSRNKKPLSHSHPS